MKPLRPTRLSIFVNTLTHDQQQELASIIGYVRIDAANKGKNIKEHSVDFLATLDTVLRGGSA